MQLPVLCSILAAGAPAAVQESGRITGRVVDGTHGVPVAGAVIEVVGGSARATSALDGRYTLVNLPAGQIAIRVRMIGYRPKTVTGITVAATGVAVQDLTIVAESVQLEELTVTAAAEQGTVASALNDQRMANNVMNSITAQEIGRSPDADAASAVQRVSGVTVQDGRYVFVRGLGERYTVTSLNGARIPSPEPEKKTVPLDLFPAGLLEQITTSKTFTPDQPGDFSGASVNLKTREFPAGRKYSMGVTFGVNDAAFSRDVVKAPTTGLEWLGFAGDERDMPAPAQAAGDLSQSTDADLNRIIASFRNAWTPLEGNGAPNSSFSLSMGGEDPVGGQMVGYLASLTYSWAQEGRAGEERALALPSGTGVEPFNQYTGSTGRTTVLWGGVVNLNTRLGETTRLAFNSSYSRGGENEALSWFGRNEEFASDLLVTRLTFTERSVFSSQLTGEHLLGGRHLADWSATWSDVSRDEPDRSDLVYVGALDEAGRPVRREWFGATRSATKTFSTLGETGWNLAGNFRFELGGRNTGRNAIKVGAAFRGTDREADTRAFDIYNRGLSLDQRTDEAERIFDGTYAESGLLTLFTNPNGGIYTATDRIAAGYAQAELWLGAVQVIAGLRLEASRLEVDSRSPQGVPVHTALDQTDVLPAVAVNLPLSERHQLRFGVSQTLARPEYRELSPVSYFEPLGGTITRGNPDLERTLIRNLDARWEWYPASGEVVSFGAFAKQFENPIEKVYVGTTGAANLSFVNADAGYNYGVEVEARKSLATLGPVLAPFSIFANATLIESRIEPGNSEVSALTNAQRPMTGQAEYVLNAGLNFDQPSGFAATLLYNVVGPRIVEAGTNPLPDAYEHARHLLDASVQVPLWGRLLMLRADGRNLLDTRVEITQGPVTRLSYRQGRQFIIGLRYGN
jgi:hypothetical protein